MSQTMLISGASDESYRIGDLGMAPGLGLIPDVIIWLQAQLAKLSRNHDFAKAINYMLRRWPAFTRFLDDGRVCLSKNAAERALQCVPLGRKAWLFCGSDRGGDRAAVLYTLI